MSTYAATNPNPAATADVIEYKPGTRSQLLGTIFGVLLTVGGGIAGLYGLLHPKMANDDRMGMTVIGGICFLVGLIAIEAMVRLIGLRVTVDANGLTHIQNGRTTSMRWDDISTVWQSITKRYTNGIYTGTTYLYTVQANDGKKLKLTNSLNRVEKLGNTIQNEVSKRHFPRALETYNSGGTVSFGNLTLNRMGLTRGSDTLAWSEIQGVQMQKGYMEIKKQGKWLRWAKIPVSSIPNLFVFLTLMDRIIGINTPKK